MKSDYEYLADRLRYEPETGDFVRIKSVPGNKGKSGNKAGSVNGDGYLLITFRGVKVAAHRLAFLYMNQRWPEHDVDHINCDRLDNRWANLREADDAGNAQNQRKAHSNSGTGILGVQASKKKFRADIQVNGVRKYLGLYATASEAHEAYIRAKRELHPTCTL